MSAALAMLTVVAALYVIGHAISILNRLHWTTHTRGYLHFLGYGLGHVLLAGGSLLAALDALHGQISLAGLVLALASAALILFDRRRTRR